MQTAWLAPELLVSMDSSPHLWFCAFKTATLRPNCCVYGSQTSPMIFCMQTAYLASELLVSMGPRPYLCFCACKTASLGAELQVSMGPRLHLSFCAFKTEWLALQLLVSMGPSPHLWILDAKQRILVQKNRSPWVPDLTSRYVLAKQRD